MAREFFINPKGPFDPYITQLFSRACAFSTHSGTGLVTLETYFTEKSEQPLHPTNKRQSLVFTPSTSPEFPPSYLISIGYDGSLRKCFLRLYDPASHKIHFWYDDTGHKPYCLSKQTMSEIQKNTNVVKNPGFDHLEEDSKYDALREMPLTVTKIIAKDPLTIGGKPTGSIRDAITAWEADIKYVENYIYDSGIEPGMIYEYKNKHLQQVTYRPSDQTSKAVDALLHEEGSDYKALANEWMRLLECPVPQYRRVAVDIEVQQQVETRVPDPELAEGVVICVSLVGSDGTSRVLILKREGVEDGQTPIPPSVKLEFYQTEEELLIELFHALLNYPIVVTFNGDDFDLKYLYHRAQRLGFRNEEIPIELGRDVAFLKYGVHIDLYKFFFNRSIQIYAFGQKYRENNLDSVGEALVGSPKLEMDSVTKASYTQLAAYCYRDSQIVLNLTSFNDDLVMKLMTALSRISYMTIDDVTRQGVSGWIRSIMFCHHRKRKYLIPRKDEILEVKGQTTTEAAIKGKKYKGAIVVEPKPGVHFKVAVLDFASLYPSIIKVWNLGYETVRCPHKDEACGRNLIPGTPHWVCVKKRGLESLLIGSLRDLRVNWYKVKSKDHTIPVGLQSWYKVVSDALKVVLNASYGVFGADNFALYCPPVAEATAAIGRHLITQTIQKAQELQLEVFYGDTDSIFLGGQNSESLNKLIEWSQRELKMELEIDKNYRYLALSSRKKNYFGVFPDGSVDIKGLTGKKRHIPGFLHSAFYQMITLLSQAKSPEDIEVVKTKITEIVKECYVKLRNKQYSLEELAFSMMMSRDPANYTKTTPQHVKAARLLQQAGTEMKPGDIISFVKVRGELGVKPVQLARLEEVDSEKYVEYLRGTFEQVLDALGVEFEDLAGTKKLESFFSG
ncbi:MAG TPA: DNA-directed DNA polymerase I [Candidatus Bathyarchaeia archaeon]|nr:DNA-directed DNA polymerase I [Candidatus Bathyarchaeia archaeon]